MNSSTQGAIGPSTASTMLSSNNNTNQVQHNSMKIPN
jgi:hypothetical protein